MQSSPRFHGRVGVFIDAANLWAAQQAQGRLIDYRLLTHALQQSFRASSLQYFYYSAYPSSGSRPYSLDSRHKFFTFLKKALNFQVRTKVLKTIFDHQKNRHIEKGNMDVEIVIDVITTLDTFDTFILCSGDSDFLPLILYLQRHQKQVYIISTKRTVSRELRFAGQGYLDIRNLPVWGPSFLPH